MRRYITLMVSAMVLLAIGFSSSTAKADPSGKPADLYLYGKINGTNSTNPGNLTTDVVKMNKISDTEWEIKLTNTNTAEAGYTFFKILAIYPNDGTWYAYSATSDTENIQITESTTDLGCWFKGTDKAAGVSWYCNYLAGKYVYIKYDASFYPNVFKVSVRNASSKPTNPTKGYLYGVLNDKANSWTSGEMAEMSKIGDNEWEIQMTQSDMTYFRVCVEFSDGRKYYYAPKDDTSDLSISMGNGYNSKIRSDQTTNGAFQGKLQNKYIQVKYNTDWDDPVYITVTDEPKYSTAEPNNIWIFGSVGNTTNWSVKDTDYKLSKTGTEKVYTGKVTFRSGDNWFHFYGGAAESGPNGTSADQPINLNEAFTTSENVDKAFKYNNTTGVDKEYDVKLVYNGKQNYTVTISNPTVVYPDKLYLFSRGAQSSDKPTLIATLNGDGKGAYTASSTVSASSTIKKGTEYYLFISDLSTGDNWDAFNDHRFSPESDQTIISYGLVDLVKNQTGVVKYTAEYDGIVDFTFTIDADAQGGKLKVETSLEGPKQLYLYNVVESVGNSSSEAMLIATLEKEQGQEWVYSITFNEADLNGFKNTTCKLFLAEKEVSGATGIESLRKDKVVWTTTNNGEINLTNNDAVTAISKNTTGGVMNWKLTDENVSAVKFTADIKKGTFTITTTSTAGTAYYLSGDINDWATEDTDEAKLRTYRFVPVSADDANLTGETNKTNWYVLYVPRMHGQFKIYNGGWDQNWGSNSSVPVDKPANANLASDGSKMGLKDNYYNNANIYFNPTDKKIFINGTAENIYVYYYNSDDVANSAIITIVESGATDSKGTMTLETLKEDDWKTECEKAPALKNVPATVENNEKVYKFLRWQVPAGLEEKYSAGGKDHYFQFYINGTSKLTSADTEVICGHNVCYIYNGSNPAVLFNYKDAAGEEVTGTTAGYEISYRLIAINADGVPEYIKEDGTRTKNRSEATAHKLDKILINGSSDGFNPTSGETWFGVSKPKTGNTIIAKEAAWTSQVQPVENGDVNRYVEFDVPLKDGESGGVYHEYHSDFELTATDGEMTGNLLPNRDTNPLYKLNGTNLYATAQTGVPTAVEEIPVDNEYDNDANAETVYYNLQGVRVTNPDRGIYIMVKGKTSKKVRF